MRKTRSFVARLVLLALFFASAIAWACETSNDVFDSMSLVEVSITRGDGSSLTFMAKLADDNRERAAGFQRICASTMEAMPILFTFSNEVKPSFHMNNVVAAIDIAFIRKNSEIDVIHTMKPYSLMSLNKPLYASRRPVIAALETHEGFFAKHRIDQMSQIHWQAGSEQSPISADK